MQPPAVIQGAPTNEKIAGHLDLSREDTAVGAAEKAVEHFRPREDQRGRIDQEPHPPHSGSLLKTAMSQTKAPKPKFRHDFRRTLREMLLKQCCNPGSIVVRVFRRR